MTNSITPTEKPITEFIEINGVRLAYSQSGSGRLVIYAHGLTLSRESDRVEGLLNFSPVAADHHLLAYDARGHGESGGTNKAADYIYPALADDLLALADHFSPDLPISVIGNSMGTSTIMHAVVKAPHRFERLVLTAPATAWEGRASQTGIYEQMAANLEDGTWQIDTMTSLIPTPAIFTDVPTYPPTPSVRAELLPTVMRGVGGSNVPSREELAKVTQPTLILAWATDPTHPVAVSEELVKLMPNAQLHIATTSADIRTWGERAAAFLSAKL